MEALLLLLACYILGGCLFRHVYFYVLFDYSPLDEEKCRAYAYIGAVVWPISAPIVALGSAFWAIYTGVFTLGKSIYIVIKHLRTVLGKE